MSRLAEASGDHDRPPAQLLRRPRMRCATLRTICAVFAMCFGASAIAQPSSSTESVATDNAVEAIQRARALAERHVAEPSPTEPPLDSAGGLGRDEIQTTDDAPRPLGVPSSASSPIDRVSAVDGDTGWVLSTLSALGVVLGLVFAARWCLTRMQNGGDPVSRNAAVEVLARVPIGNRQRVMLLRVGGRVVVVGDAGGGLSTLAEIDDEQEVADLLQSVSASRSTSAASGFGDLYRQMTGRAAARTDPGDRDAGLPGRSTDAGEAYTDRSQDEVRRLLSRVRGAAASFAGAAGGRG